MRLGRLLIAMGVVGAAANGCGGGAFESADAESDAGEASSSGGSKGSGGSKTNSGGNSTTQPGGAGDDSGTDEGGADNGTGGSATPLGGKSSGGQPPLGGAAGNAMAGTSGSGGAGTGGAGTAGNSSGVDGPLKIADLEAIDAVKLTGVHATGFRCKSLTICGNSQTCAYYTGFLGSVQAQEEAYSDGDELDDPLAVKVRIGNGAQSDPNQCASSLFTLQPGQFAKLTHDGGHTVQVYFPEFSGPELVLYIHANGSTYWDAALTQLAGSPN